MSTKTSKAHYDQLISALQALASACDGAVDRDGVGFNGTDSRFGRSIAEDSYTRQLSPKVQTIAIKMVQKYRKQLMGYGVVNLPTQAEYGDGYGGTADPAPKAKERKPETVIRGQDGVIHVKFNHNITSNKDRLKDGLTWTDRRWHGATKEWIVQPRAAADLLALFPHAEVDPRVKEYAEGLGVESADQVPSQPEEVRPAPKMTVRLVKDLVIMKTPFFSQVWLDDCKAVPDRKFKETKQDGKHWRAPVSAIPWIVENWKGREDIDLGGGVMEAHANLMKRAEMSRAADGVLVEDLPIPDGLVPYGYQKAGFNFLREAGYRALLADDMGLGKTIQAIMVIMSVRHEGPVLVSCPATVKLNWERELVKWIPGIRVNVLEGRTPKEAIDISKTDVFVINHDILATREVKADDSEVGGIPFTKGRGAKKKEYIFRGWIEQFLAVKFSLVIFDEGHKVGNTQTAIRGQAASMICKENDRVIFLTGTPLPNRPKELWPILNMIDPAAWGDFFGYAKRYCDAVQNKFGWDFNGASNLDELHTRIQPWVLRRMKTDPEIGLDLPEKTRVDIVLDIPKRFRTKYDRAVADFAKMARKNNGYISPADRLTHMGNLKQLAAEAKLKQGIEWITDFVESGNKLIVFAVHHATIDAVIGALKKAKIGAVKIDGRDSLVKRQAAVDTFQDDPDVPVFVGNIQAAGEGITLTAAADVVFLEYGWKPGEHSQAEDRAYRIGQRNAVTVWYLNAKGTIDGLLFNIIDGKRMVIDAVLEGAAEDHESTVMVMTEDSANWTDTDFLEAMTTASFR